MIAFSHNASLFNGLQAPSQLLEAFVERAIERLQGVRALVRPGYFNLVDVRFFFPECGFDETLALAVALDAVETLLGRETFARWIGDIDVRPQSASDERLLGSRLIGPDQLLKEVRGLIEDAEAELPDRPWHQMDLDASWSAVEGEPEEAGDYPDQRDLIAGMTVLPMMWQNARSSIPFDSARFSRFGERFCYLKTDGAGGWEYSRFTDREEIELAIDRSLRDAGLGSVIGGGTGLRYSYIELALADVDEAWQELGIVLSEGRLPKRTWLLFHDTELSSQWFGLYDDTPQPPFGRRLPLDDLVPRHASSRPVHSPGADESPIALAYDDAT